MIQLVWLIVVAGLAYLAFLAREVLPYAVGGAIALVAIGWIVVSAMWPSKPDRRCPTCGESGLVKIRRGEPGVVCEQCGFRDESMHVAYLDDW